jgi:hypothetical protein
MTLQTSGAISLSQIQSEHGGSNPIGLNEYYRGGTNVQDHNNTDGTNNTTAIPTSGTISLNQFYGSADAATVTTDAVGVFTFATETGKITSHTGFALGASGAWNAQDGSSANMGSASDDSYTTSGGDSITLRGIFATAAITPGRIIFAGDQTASDKLGTNFTVTLSGANSLSFTAQNFVYNSTYNETYAATQQASWNTGVTTVTFSGGNF